jgi:1,4-dihydroxy-6-naphthoate synthase
VKSKPIYKLGFSTCPNDTFMFGGLINGLTSWDARDLNLLMADIETLNDLAMRKELDFTKISFSAYAFIAEHYRILDSGSAVGYKNGPLLVSRKKIYPDEIPYLHIAIPGRLTTAMLLLQILYPGVKKSTPVLFSLIEDAVMDGEFDAGLIIHESRFTYRRKGLLLVSDLGEKWEKEFLCPVPLGGIVARRSLDNELVRKFQDSLSDSIVLANKSPEKIWQFVRENAKEMDDDVMQLHINLYVNEFSVILGETGRKAVRLLLTKGYECGLLPQVPDDIFYNPKYIKA